MFDQDFFKGNRARLRQKVGGGLIVLTANGLLQRNGDNTFRFRQDSNFWYLTGIEDADVVLVMDDEDEYLIIPTRDAVMETFEGKVEAEAVAKASGIATILEPEAGWQRLGKRLKPAKTLATLVPPPAYLDHYQFYTNPARANLVEKIKSYNASIELADIREHMAAMRVVKQAPELAAIRRAVDVTVDAFLHITDGQRFKDYKYEYEVEADITSCFRRAGYGHAFEPIVVGGKRGTQMHVFENSERLKHAEMVIIDIGAEAGLYAADVARTVMSGTPSGRQQALYDAVCEAQDYAYSLIKPGIIHADYEKLNEAFIGEKLRELGIIKTAERDDIRRHFPHMMSHFVGLEPHDVGDYKQPMQAGSVMVVEPGMYSFDEGLGVRVEDVVAITEDGYELLSRKLPRQLKLG